MSMPGTLEPLLAFFREEFRSEEELGFPRLSRIPSTFVAAELSQYRSLSHKDQLASIDCIAHFAHRTYGFVVDAPEFDHTLHPYYREWSIWPGTLGPSVPLARATVQQYKIDAHKGVRSSIGLAEFETSSSVLERSLRAPELRKHIRAALKPIGYYKQDHFGYWCRKGDQPFCVRTGFGGPRARCQLSYAVARADFPRKAFSFERALGLVMGDQWDYIVNENVDECMSVFTELVAYSYALPDRIKAAVA